MTRRTIPRILTRVAIVTMVVSALGFIAGLLLNFFLFDKYDHYDDYDAYAEAPISGANDKVDLKAGDMTVYLHTVRIEGIDIPIPHIRIRAPGGAEATMREDHGRWTTGDEDTHVRIGDLHVPADGSYEINVDGDVDRYQKPSLAFGEPIGYRILTTVFAVSFGLAVVVFIVARVWAARVRRSSPSDELQAPAADLGSAQPSPPVPPVPAAPVAPVEPVAPPIPTPAQLATTVPNLPAAPNLTAAQAAPTLPDVPTLQAPPTVPVPTQEVESAPPSDEEVRQQSLETLASLRESGVLTEDEYQAERKRVLEGR